MKTKYKSLPEYSTALEFFNQQTIAHFHGDEEVKHEAAFDHTHGHSHGHNNGHSKEI
jgi:hypothetical protein